jgi:hypothetical protein
MKTTIEMNQVHYNFVQEYVMLLSDFTINRQPAPTFASVPFPLFTLYKSASKHTGYISLFNLHYLVSCSLQKTSFQIQYQFTP